ncbi:metallophosphoesterase family protein [Chryseobacterium sp. 22543]|uniref:metallophosphoesterase family protein n=1 Tax=Chryseobacterium sp. 22543 TaxID=3453940 RepID=UPI003F83EABC
MKKIKIAVISDLHCHPKKSEKENCTTLFTNILRDDINSHPVQSFIEYYNGSLQDDFPTVDYLLCPGDVTNYSDLQGFISGWDYVKEISSLFQAGETYATLGNHDIDSRHINTAYFLTIPKGIKKNYPISDQEIGTFWEKGFTFIEKEELQLLVINTTHFHTHTDEVDSPTVKGLITIAAIQEIDRYLIAHHDDTKIKIMMCHHHPIQHDDKNLGAYDFVENGDQLVATLAKHKFDLIIHGHKHFPKFKKYSTDSGEIQILSSGSFSATNQIQFASKFNYVHLIEIEKKDGVSRGIIKTPNYKFQIGWHNNSEGFDYKTGFGSRKQKSEILREITKITNDEPIINWEDLCNKIEDLKFLMANELQEIIDNLKEINYGVTFDESKYPDVVYNNAKLKERLAHGN